MNYKIVELEDFTGEEATIYSIIENGEEYTIFEKFIAEYQDEYGSELANIADRLYDMGHEFGTGDLVCALYDDPDKHLRLYCIRFGSLAIIVGGGGPKNTRTWQEDEKLTQEAERMIKVSQDIYNRILDKEIEWSADGRELLGNLEFNDYA